MNRNLLRVFLTTLTFVLIGFSAFAQKADVKVSTNSELEAALNDAKYNVIKVAEPGYYQSIDAYADQGLFLFKGEDNGAKGPNKCVYSIETGNGCMELDANGNVQTTTIALVSKVVPQTCTNTTPSGTVTVNCNCPDPDKGLWQVTNIPPGATVILTDAGTNASSPVAGSVVVTYNGTNFVYTPVGVADVYDILKLDALNADVDKEGIYEFKNTWYAVPGDDQTQVLGGVHGTFYYFLPPEVEIVMDNTYCETEDLAGTVNVSLGNIPGIQNVLTILELDWEWKLDGVQISPVTAITDVNDIANQGAQNFTLGALACGLHTLTITVSTSDANTQELCGKTDEVSFYVFDKPSVSVMALSEVCGLTTTVGNFYDLSCHNNVTPTVEWTKVSGPGTATFTSGSYSTNIAVDQCGKYEFKYKVTNGDCVKDTTIMIKYYDTPVITDETPNHDVCGLEAPLKASYAAACTFGGTPTVTWTNVTPGSVVTITNADALEANVEVPVCGEYKFEVAVQNGTCIARDTVMVKFYDTPVLTDNVTYHNFCGLQAGLNVSSSVDCTFGTNPTVTWTSSVAGVTFSEVNSLVTNVTVPACGEYDFLVTVVNGPCTATKTVTYKFYDTPVLTDNTPEHEVCGLEADLKFAAAINCDFNATPTVTWTTINPNVVFADANALETGVTVPACGEYEFIVSVLNGPCVAVDTIMVKFYDTPVLTDNVQDHDICGLETDLNVSSAVDCTFNVTPTVTWTSTVSGVTFADANSLTTGVTVPACGKYEFLVTVVNGPCTATKTVTYKFYDTPVLTDNTPEHEVCGLEADLNVAATVACEFGVTSTVTWTASSASVTFTAADALMTGVTVPVCGEYEFLVTVVNGPCTATKTVTVKFYDTPVLTDNVQDHDICGLETDLNVSSAVDCTFGANPTVTWTSSVASVTFADANSLTTGVTVPACGEYEFLVTVVNGPCTATKTVTYKFYDTPVLADNTPEHEVCGLEADLNVAATVACEFGVTSTVTWTASSASVTFSEANSLMTGVTVPSCGEYEFLVTVVNGPCTATKTVTVKFYDKPVITTNDTAPEVCGLDGELIATYDVTCDFNVTPTLTWSTTASGVVIADPNAGKTDVTVPSCGEYDFLVTVVNGSCTATKTVTVKFYEKPEINIAGPTDVTTCTERVYTVENLACEVASQTVNYNWTIEQGTATPVTLTGETVTITFDQNEGTVTVTVVANIQTDPTYSLGCVSTKTITIEKEAPIFEGQVKYWNQYETYMPSPYSTQDYATYPHDYFYVSLVKDTTVVATKKVMPRLAEDLQEYMSYFKFDINTPDWGCDYDLKLKIWDGGLVYHNGTIPPGQLVGKQLGNSYTYKNWCGVNAIDALAIQLMASGIDIHSAPYNQNWINVNTDVPAYGYYSHSVADVNSSNIYTTGGITALDALTAKYRSVGLIANYPDNGSANDYGPNFRVTGRMVDMLPEITFPKPFDDDNLEDIRFDHSGVDYKYFTPAVDHAYTSEVLPWRQVNKNKINIYYQSVGDVNASCVPENNDCGGCCNCGCSPCCCGGKQSQLVYNGSIHVEAGDIVTIPVTAQSNVKANAISLMMNYRNDLVEVLSTNYNEEDAYINHEQGIVNIAWYNMETAKTFEEGDVIAQVKVRVLADINADTEIFTLSQAFEMADASANTIKGATVETVKLTNNAPVVNATELTASNYPNPFKGQTTISYVLPENGHVTVKVYNNQGMLVTTLVDAAQNAGAQNIVFNATISGVYFYNITVEGERTYSVVNKMIVK